MKTKIVKGTFTSEWDCGTVVTEATLNTKTGEVTTHLIKADFLENNAVLEREYFTNKDGDELGICHCCHKFVNRYAMKDGIGHNYEEVECCMDKNCESNKE